MERGILIECYEMPTPEISAEDAAKLLKLLKQTLGMLEQTPASGEFLRN